MVATARLRAEGFADAQRLDAGDVGREVIFVAGQGRRQRQIAGVIRFVSPEVDPVTGQVRVWAEMDNRQGLLRPGERGALQLLTEAEIGTER